jgi:hypothetical protein
MPFAMPHPTAPLSRAMENELAQIEPVPPDISRAIAPLAPP